MNKQDCVEDMWSTKKDMVCGSKYNKDEKIKIVVESAK